MPTLLLLTQQPELEIAVRIAVEHRFSVTICRTEEELRRAHHCDVFLADTVWQSNRCEQQMRTMSDEGTSGIALVQIATTSQLLHLITLGIKSFVYVEHIHKNLLDKVNEVLSGIPTLLPGVAKKMLTLAKSDANFDNQKSLILHQLACGLPAGQIAIHLGIPITSIVKILWDICDSLQYSKTE